MINLSANQIDKSRSYATSLFAAIMMVTLPSMLSFWSQDAQAHKGHGGSLVKIIKKKAALKEMLPAGAKVSKRKQKLTEDAAEWAEKTYSVSLDRTIYSFYVARDRKSGKTLGAAIISKSSYRHGDVMIAVGVDADGRVTKTAITGVSEKYMPDFEGTTGTGFITTYDGKSLSELVDMTKELESADKPSRQYSSRVRDAAVLLSAFIRE